MTAQETKIKKIAEKMLIDGSEERKTAEHIIGCKVEEMTDAQKVIVLGAMAAIMKCN